MDSYDWLKTGRVLIVDGYCPPLYPKIDFDADRMVQIVKETGGNIVRMQPIGYYAYYPTKHFPVHPDLGGRDLLQEMIDACRPEGIKVIPYIPVGHPFLPLDFEGEPYNSWAARNRDGERKRGGWHYGYFRNFPICLNSPYREAIRAIVREITASYDVDGIYFDGPNQPNPRWMFGVCYCEYCRKAYYEATGKEIPHIGERCDWNDPEVRRYYEWVVEEVTSGTLRDLYDIVKQIKDIPVLFNNGLWLSPNVAMWVGNRRYELADGFLFEAAETLIQKMQNVMLGRSTGKYVWCYIGDYGRWQFGHLRSEHSYAFKWLSVPIDGPELTMEGYTVMASGGSPIFWATNRFYYERKGTEYLKPVFNFMERHAEILQNMAPAKFIGLLVSGDTADWYLKEKGSNPYRYYYQGGFEVLKEAHHQVEPIYAHKLSFDRLREYPVLFLPNAACMSDEDAEVIKRYVAEGGNLIATHETSRYDQNGDPRPDFALSDLFGARLLREDVEEYTDLYLKIVRPHPVTQGFEPGQLIPQDFQVLRVEVQDPDEVLATTYRMGFEEELGPALVARQCGEGKVVYIPSGLEAVYPAARFEQVRRLFEDIVRWLAGGKVPYRIAAPTGVVANLMEGPDRLLLHLLNNNGDKNKRTHCREDYVPAFDIGVEVRIPEGRVVREVRFLNSGEKPNYSVEGGWLKVKVTCLELYEGISIELG